jgi:excisionase family DNA binding protein
MPTFGLRDAARQVGVTKSTIHRAVQQGRLSASRTDGGGYAIDAAELFRVYPPKVSRGSDGARRSAAGGEGHDAPSPEARDGTDGTDLRVRCASLEGDVRALQAETRLLREMVNRLEAERDRWAAQAERLALAAPAKARSWWPWRRSA